jgi:hypothetical protein
VHRRRRREHVDEERHALDLGVERQGLSGRSENVSTLIPHARKASATSGMLTCERTAPRYA